MRKLHDRAVSPSGGASTSFTDSFHPTPSKSTSTSAAPRPRESLDGETIFAVGEGDDIEWSDGEEVDDEGKRLTRKISA